MEVTRRIDYACRIIRAAYRANGEFLSISTISEEENIPYAFARNIQHVLLRAGFVKTRRGAHGGLSLNIDPAELTVYQLMRELEVDLSLAPCADEPDTCENSDDCGFNKVWREAGYLLKCYFDSLCLKDVIEGNVEVSPDRFALGCPNASAEACAACETKSCLDGDEA